MKIYMVHGDPWQAGNPYIYTLIEEMQTKHPDVSFAWGINMFWTNAIFSYDIVHFHWPQAFMAMDGGQHTIRYFCEWIDKIKSHGIKIIATCHDLVPHYNQCADYGNALDIVYSRCDTILHLGEYSKRLFEEKYSQIQHIVLPHHLYDTVYKKNPSKYDALCKLGLKNDKRYILCLGMFRAEEEREFIISVAEKMNDRSIAFLAPSFMEVKVRKHFGIIPTRSQIKKWWLKYKYNIFMTGQTWVPVSDEDLPYYYAASDIAFIHRLKILNSGNAVMPMLFGKVVVGPATGNVELLLKRWGYPTFDPYNIDSVKNAIEEGFRLSEENYGLSIRREQMEEYSTKNISELLYEIYSRKIANKI